MAHIQVSSEGERIRRMVARVDSGAALASDEQAEILDDFERHECWEPYFRLLKRQIGDPAQRSVEAFARLARVQNLYLEDTFQAAETCAAMVDVLGLPYRRFAEDVLPKVIEFEDFAAEAAVLSAVCDRFRNAADLIACLERLCMLYEKKTHNEQQLDRTYKRLREVDPTNVKALRYFKLFYTQANEWEEVVAILHTLLRSVMRQQEVYRVAQELAAIYLYQLDLADEAIATIENYCEGSSLDPSQILFDAHQRLSDWQGCLKVLRQCLVSVHSEQEQAILHHRIAGVQERQGDLDGAFDNYGRAATLWPELLDAIEGVITLGLARRDWAAVQHWLGVLAERVHDERLTAQVKQAAKRLAEGAAGAGKKDQVRKESRGE